MDIKLEYSISSDEFQGNGIGLKIVNELKKLIENGVKK